MGLNTAMNTALTGMRAAETQIDVTGNNLANAQTVGFKASDTLFASQFYRTYSLGSAPTGAQGGTNPMQVGLGVQVAEIRPDFSQGTIDISSSQTDMAIQGDGFFMVEGIGGGEYYTRNGMFKLNASQELVSSTGNRLLGYGVDENFVIQENQLVPLTIPLGGATIAAPTQNVVLQGNLNTMGDLADTAEVIDSAVLGNGAIPRADAGGSLASQAPLPSVSGVGTGSSPGSSGFTTGQRYEYVLAFADAAGLETMASQSLSVTIGNNDEQVTLSSLPGSPQFGQLNVYRRAAGDTDYLRIGTTASGAASFVDNGLAPTTALDTTSLNGPYSYVVTFSGVGVPESRPSLPLTLTVTNGRVLLENLPPLPSGPGVPSYDTVNVYRNTLGRPGDYFLVSSVSPGATYLDYRPDVAITDPSSPNYRQANLDGPPITDSTLLTDIVSRDGLDYAPVFSLGTLEFQGRKGGAGLTEKNFEVTATATVADLVQFMSESMGIQSGSGIPPSQNHLPGGGGGTLAAGGFVTADGRLRFVSNNGVGNALAISGDGVTMTDSSGTPQVRNLGFQSVQQAVGESAATSFQVFDSLGNPANVRLTTVLESRDGSSATFRWYADSGDNDPAGPDTEIAVGTGTITFDSQGNVLSTSNPTISIQRQDMPSVNPLAFQLDLGQLNGFASGSEIAATEQDGAPPGQLTSFNIGEEGRLRGLFSNGLQRDLGQIRLARFTNPAGLEQTGDNLYSQAPNSGLPIVGNPGEFGLGGMIAGAVEMSNTDMGQSLIDLVLASTQYRSNSRVISTAQQLIDELLNLRR